MCVCVCVCVCVLAVCYTLRHEKQLELYLKLQCVLRSKYITPRLVVHRKK
jgi:hypothetical protein